MDNPIFTQRLQLIPLDLNQLELLLQDVDAFKTSLKISMLREFISERVCRGIPNQN